MKISELFLKYQSDKNEGSLYPSDHLRGHTYGKSYDKIFEKFDRKSNFNILEIGIQKGGSMLAWKDYFENSNIYGVDIVDCILPEYRREDFNYIFDDIKSNNVTKILSNLTFDIIIDDGSHFLSDVLFTVSNYLSKLNDGGVLIIEDCQHPEGWIEEIGKLVDDNYRIITADLRYDRGQPQYDNFLIIIEKQ
jgi:hypothetical protein